ncbi:uncharacterized protein LOC122650663 [Telopea speciosissima]|uniref:uncharacterized protein LOC122650663 n=1 Tax=Telopea speciosissima TaxID=54955 RepID=UPI001CC5EDA7|nr:uncharacterized protein LOC122650663 [Telopea speciosissima]
MGQQQQQMGELLQKMQWQQQQFMATITTQMQANAQNVQPPPGNPTANILPRAATAPPRVINDATSWLMKRFLKIQPLTFGGITNDTLQPMKWVKEMEKAFELLGCTEAQKLQCARYKLQHEAEAWWQTTKPILAAAHPELTWEIFKEAFFGSYFPSCVRRKKEVEFTELNQGPKSVLEYQQMFEELFFFAPEHMKTDEAKARKFEDGLRPSLGHVMVAHKAQGYSEVVQWPRQ